MLPTFLGIGPARTASTWLNWILGQHPQIQMTIPKECSFFGKMILHHNLDWCHQRLAVSAASPARTLRGDISPWYSRLTDQNVRTVHAILPNAKIILVLRNPIDRSWSQALLELGTIRRISLDQVPVREALLHCERSRNARYSDYLTIIRRWTSFYGRAALHLALYDALLDRPVEYISGILRHIGADERWQPSAADYSNHLWSTRSQPGGAGLTIPPFARWYLSKKWHRPVRRLNEFLGGKLDKWVSEMDEVLSKPVPTAWSVRRNLYKSLLSAPEHLAYLPYHFVREARLAHRNAIVLRQHAADSEIGVTEYESF